MTWRNFDEQETQILTLEVLNEEYVKGAISTYKSLYSLIHFPKLFNKSYHAVMVLLIFGINRSSLRFPGEHLFITLCAAVAVVWGTVRTRREAEQNAAKFYEAHPIIHFDESQRLARRLSKTIREQKNELRRFLRWAVIFAGGMWAMEKFLYWEADRGKASFNISAQEFIKEGIVLAQHPYVLKEFPEFISAIYACHREMENGVSLVIGNGRKLFEQTMKPTLNIFEKLVPMKKLQSELFNSLGPGLLRMTSHLKNVQWEMYTGILFFAFGVGYTMLSSIMPALVFSGISLFMLTGRSLLLQSWRDWQLARHAEIYKTVLPKELGTIVTISCDSDFNGRLNVQCSSFNTTIAGFVVNIHAYEYAPLLMRLLAPLCKYIFIHEQPGATRRPDLKQEYILIEPQARNLTEVKVQIDALMLRLFSLKLYGDDLRRIFAHFLGDSQLSIDYQSEIAPMLASKQLLNERQVTIVNQLLQRHFPTHPPMVAGQPLRLREANVGFIRGMFPHCLGLISPDATVAISAPRRRQAHGSSHSTDQDILTVFPRSESLPELTWTVRKRSWRWAGFENEKALGVRALNYRGAMIYVTLAKDLLEQVGMKKQPAVQFLMDFFDYAHLVGEHGSGIKLCKAHEMVNDNGVPAKFKLKHAFSNWRFYGWLVAQTQTQEKAPLYEFSRPRLMNH